MLACIGTCLFVTATHAEIKPAIAIIGTGDMGDSLGPRFVELGYQVIYDSRNPEGEKAQAGDIVILAVPWPAMEPGRQSDEGICAAGKLRN